MSIPRRFGILLLDWFKTESFFKDKVKGKISLYPSFTFFVSTCAFIVDRGPRVIVKIPWIERSNPSLSPQISCDDHWWGGGDDMKKFYWNIF